VASEFVHTGAGQAGVAEKVAELKGISIEKVKERTTDNAVSLFAL